MPFADVEQELSDTMVGYWTRFAATGDPNGDGAPEWRRFGAAEGRIFLGEEVRSATDNRGHGCGFWRDLVTRPRLLPEAPVSAFDEALPAR